MIERHVLLKDYDDVLDRSRRVAVVTGGCAIAGPAQIDVIASALIARARSLVPRMLSIPPWNVVARGPTRSATRTLTGEGDGAMNEIFRREKFRVTGASQFHVTMINANDKKEPASG